MSNAAHAASCASSKCMLHNGVTSARLEKHNDKKESDTAHTALCAGSKCTAQNDSSPLANLSKAKREKK